MSTSHEKIEYRFNANQYPLNPGVRLLEASAGTGKTFALAHLVLRLLTERGLDIRELLVVTFTDAAASELRSRITKRLSTALNGIENIDKKNPSDLPDDVIKEWLNNQIKDDSNMHKLAGILIRALESIDYADITTIHGYCRRTLLREPILTGTTINPSLEANGRAHIIKIAHDYWKNHILQLNSQDVLGLIEAGFNQKSLIDAISKVDNDPVLEVESIAKDTFDKPSLVYSFDNLIINYWENFVINWEKEGKELEINLRHYAKERKIEGCLDTKPFSSKPRKDRAQVVSTWIKSVEIVERKIFAKSCPSYSEIRKQINLGRYYHPGVFLQVSTRCGDIHAPLSNAKVQEAVADIWDGPVELVWRHALQWSKEAITKMRKQKGIMSYGELLKKLDPGEALTDPNIHTAKDSATPLINSLRKRYKAVLVDEFQDTDPVQWRILKQTFGESTEHLLIMVGDPKQAIYRFRGGDLNTYLKAKNEVDRIDKLTDNYRTNKKLMTGLNQLIAPSLIRSKLTAPISTAYRKENILLLDDNNYPLEVLILEDKNDNSINRSEVPISKVELERRIPIAVANYLLKLLKQKNNNLKLSDICILVNRHEQAKSIRSSLSKSGLPTRLLHQGDIFKSVGAEIIQKLLNCLSQPTNISHLKLLGCSPLLQWQKKDFIALEEKGMIDELVVKIQQIKNKIKDIGVWGCINEIVTDEIISDLYTKGNLISELKQCSQIIDEEMLTQKCELGYITMWLKRERLRPVEPIPDNRQPHSDIAESAINVVTIHRSKGQEYPIVICPYLCITPPTPKGPIWRNGDDQRWCIAVNNNWGKGKKLASKALEASLEESERLAYVALTRAREKLILIWSQAEGQESNPLTGYLFGHEAIHFPLLHNTKSVLEERIKNKKFSISINDINSAKILNRWEPHKEEIQLSLGPTPKRILDRTWGRSSYSSWVSSSPSHVNDKESQKESTLKEVSIERKSIENGEDEIRGPLADFPRGKSPGDCLHRILENLDLSAPIDSKESIEMIKRELKRSSIDVDFLPNIQSGIERVVNTKLGKYLGNLKLSQLNSDRRIHEMDFEIPISTNGNPVTEKHIAKIFELNPESQFSTDYADKVKHLDIYSKGFLSGSIDLLFSDQEDLSLAKWWVVDWKSNWIGNIDNDDNQIECGPFHYTEEAMYEQMVMHHYPLQAHLYLVALHRYLKWRLPKYIPNHHLGGYIYIFLRGLADPGIQRVNKKSSNRNLSGVIIEKAMIKRIISLDKLFSEGS